MAAPLDMFLLSFVWRPAAPWYEPLATFNRKARIVLAALLWIMLFFGISAFEDPRGPGRGAGRQGRK